MSTTARATLIEAAQALGLSVEERPIRLDELPRVDEAFITSSMNLVVPVTWIDQAAHSAHYAELMAPYELYLLETISLKKGFL